MNLILTIAIIIIMLPAMAQGKYYFNEAGNDTNPGTITQPFQTITKLNSLNLKSGDTVFLNQGDNFYGSITISASGVVNAPIVISSYGSAGNKPVLTTLVDVAGWTSEGGGVWRSAPITALPTTLQVLTINDVIYGIGRYPDLDQPNKGYLTLEARTGTTSITDNQLSGSPNWTGADVVIRSSRWTIDKSKITNHAGTVINYIVTTPYTTNIPPTSYGYFFQNHRETLSKFGEWYHDPISKTILIYSGANPPVNVQVATKTNLVYALNKSYVVFDNITFKGANGDGILINGGGGNIIKNCDVIFSGIDGIRSTSVNFKVENSNILYAYNNGINVENATSTVIKNNLIKHTYFIAGMGQNSNGQGGGIRNGYKGSIENNRIINSGYVAIQMGGDYAIIKDNFIDTFCFVKDDGGGIYTSNGTGVINIGKKIIGNTVMNGIGAKEGANSPNISTKGIYLDDYVNGTEVTGNFVSGCYFGYLLHNAYNNILRGNTADNNTVQLYIQNNSIPGKTRNNILSNNTFISRSKTQYVFDMYTQFNDVDLIGRIDSNFFYRGVDTLNMFKINYNLNGKQVNGYFSLSQWKKAGPYDKNSVLLKTLEPGILQFNVRRKIKLL